MIGEEKKLLVIAGGNYIFGAEKVTLDVIEGLVEDGYEVKAIISGWGNGQFARSLDSKGVGFYKLKLGWYYISKLLWSLDSFIHYPGAILRFIRIRKNFKDWPVYIISFRQVILLWPFFKKNIVYHVHDANSISKQSVFFFKLIDKKVVRYIAVSDFVKQDLVKCGIAAEKIEVIHNGIDLNGKAQQKKSSGEELTIGIVGQIIKRKGHVALIEAINILCQKGLKIRLIIAGSGDAVFVEELNTMIKDLTLTDNILWRGFKESAKDIYEGIDIVVAPTTLPEPFGLITIEANIFGLPVIASNAGGFMETVKDGFNGFLIDPLKPTEIAEKIEYFYFNRSQLELMGENGRVLVKKSFNRKLMIAKIVTLLRDQFLKKSA